MPVWGNSGTAAAQVAVLQSIQLDRHTHSYTAGYLRVCVCAMSCVCVWLNGLFTLITQIWQMFARLMSRSVCVCVSEWVVGMERQMPLAAVLGACKIEKLTLLQKICCFTFDFGLFL